MRAVMTWLRRLLVLGILLTVALPIELDVVFVGLPGAVGPPYSMLLGSASLLLLVSGLLRRREAVARPLAVLPAPVVNGIR